MEIFKSDFGSYDGIKVYLFRICNSSGLEVSITNYGAIITSVLMPDKKGHKANVVLSCDSLEEYVADKFYVGALVGRFAGRINNGSFQIGNTSYQLSKNDTTGFHHLHGGITGFNKKVFEVGEINVGESAISVTFHYLSPNKEEGYPGNLSVQVTYVLTCDNKLIITYHAQTDQITYVNLTNHSYFNLSGYADSALEQELVINANNYLETDHDYIPTGNIMPIRNSPYDFTKSTKIITLFDQLQFTGYNEYFILNNTGKMDAVLNHAESGRKISLKTTMPGLLFYTGDYLNGKYQKNQGICLETQLFPDAPNHENFPSALLVPSQTFFHETILKMSW